MFIVDAVLNSSLLIFTIIGKVQPFHLFFFFAVLNASNIKSSSHVSPLLTLFHSY